MVAVMLCFQCLVEIERGPAGCRYFVIYMSITIILFVRYDQGRTQGEGGLVPQWLQQYYSVRRGHPEC